MAKIWGAGKKRRPGVPKGVVKQVVARAKGRCERCGIGLHGLRYHIHHKDMDPSNNEPSNLVVLCTNCHSRVEIHPPRPEKEPSFEESVREMEDLVRETVWGTPRKKKK